MFRAVDQEPKYLWYTIDSVYTERERSGTRCTTLRRPWRWASCGRHPCHDHSRGTREAKVPLFVLVYLWASCDFLPAISRFPFLTMWKFVLKSVRCPGLFAKSIFLQTYGIWTVDPSEGVTLLATVWFFKHEAAFAGAKTESPGDILPADGDVKKYVEVIRLSVLELSKGRPINCCPPYGSLLLHVKRSRSVFHIWQDGLQIKMPKPEFKGEGWDVDPKKEADKDAPLTAKNVTIELSEHCYIDAERKTQLLICGCDPEKAANDNHRCNRCSCKGKRCSLLCGCRGRCYLRSPLSAVVSTGTESEGKNTDGGEGESERETESDGGIAIDALGGDKERGGNTPIGISGGGDPEVLGWLSADSDDDVTSEIDSDWFLSVLLGRVHIVRV